MKASSAQYLTDEELVFKIVETNISQLFAILYHRFSKVVYNKCFGFSKNKEEAEDLTHDIFIRLFVKLKTFKGNSKLSTWIYRIATNKCLEFIRKHNTKKRFAFLQNISGNELPLDRTNYFTEINHPGIQLENKQTSEMLFKAINQLPEAQSIVFTLHKVDDKSHDEISEILNKSVSSIESLMFRAKRNLQVILEDFYKNEI